MFLFQVKGWTNSCPTLKPETLIQWSEAASSTAPVESLYTYTYLSSLMVPVLALDCTEGQLLFPLLSHRVGINAVIKADFLYRHPRSKAFGWGLSNWSLRVQG